MIDRSMNTTSCLRNSHRMALPGTRGRCRRVLAQTRRFFGGRQPLCGSGVTSSMALINRPEACRAVTADSRPEPGPLMRTSISFSPNLAAFSAAVSLARWAANGVLLRLPLKPTVPAGAVVRVSPLVSVIVMIVLLNVAWMWATPRLTFRRAFRFLLFATLECLPHAPQRPPVVTGGSESTHLLDALLPGDRLA